MPPAPDERTLLTLFADVRYFISPPTQRPPHHRFEKASYFYLYHSQTTGTARVEIANNPGTPHQDAFTGSLPGAALTQSYKQPSLVTLTVATRAQDPDAARGEASQAALWQLKDFNADRGVEYLYLLHAVDVYFWTERDAERFVDAVAALGPGAVAALDVRGKPAPPPAQHQHQQQPQSQHQLQPQAQPGTPASSRTSAQLSPVVAALEQAAITPAYGHANQQRDSISTLASTHTQPQPLPGPPPPRTNPQYAAQPTPPGGRPYASSPASSSIAAAAAAAPAPAATATAHTPQSPPPGPPPLAYNPAAPAAPEPIAPREKTPPPPDLAGGSGTGLAHADAPASFSPPPPPPPLQHTPTSNSLYAAPTPPGLAPGQRVNSLPFSAYAGAPQQQQQQQQQQQVYQPGSGAGSASPPAYAYTPSPPPLQYQQHQQQQQQQQQQGGHAHVPDASAIHATAYRPSEAEMAAQGKGGAAAGVGGQGKGGRFDRGVDRFLKKLDKSWG